MKTRVLHQGRAAGVHPRLLSFLGWWQFHGLFPLVVLPDGGIRTDEAKQLSYFMAKPRKSAARTLRDTPHGRGAALDLAPFIAGAIPWHDWDRFRVVGLAAEVYGLVWGGRWPERDGPHVEIPGWRSLPFPPVPFETS